MTAKIHITREMKRQFRSETAEHLDQFEKLLMTIEQDPRRSDVIHAAFRYVHSIKGNSDYLGIADINELAHIIEDLMDDVRGERIAVTQAVVDLMFQGLDLLKDMNRRVADPEYRETDLSAIRAALANLTPSPAAHAGEGREAAEDAPPLRPGKEDLAVSDVLEQEIKVDIGKIDRFMEHLSEFAEAQNTLHYLASAADGGGEKWIGDIRKASANLKKVFNNFQTDIMALRLVKLDALFDRLRRMVRDLSRKQGKIVELTLSGGEIAVDRKIMGHLVDPLVHLLRNAVDHGIATPAERTRDGRPEAGTIIVDARMEGVHVVIDVADDGRGLDPARIRESALAGGFADTDALSGMSDADLARLLFQGGFTTLETANTVSGRGVGLDVVENAVTAIGGSVGLSVDRGRGVRVSLRAPISMSVTEVLLVRSDEDVYAVPFSGVRRIIRVRRRRLRGFKQTEMLAHEEGLMVVRTLGDWLAPGDAGRPLRHGDDDGEISVVVVGGPPPAGRLGGMAVDAVLRRESVMIRPLRRFLTGFRAFSGAAVLGGGRVVMVIDPMGIMETSGQ